MANFHQLSLSLALVVCLMVAGGAKATDNQANRIIEEIEEEYSYAAGDASGAADEEVNQEHLLFSDFCLQSQDVFKTYLHEKVGGTAAQIYNILLTSVGSVGSEVLKAHEDSTAQGTKLIATPGNSDMSLAQKMLQALKMVLDSMLGTAQATIFERIAALRATYSVDMLRANVEEACMSISGDLQRRLDNKLSEAKTSLKRASAKAPNGKELLQIAQKAKIDRIGCGLTTRVSKVAKACDMIKLAGPRIWAAIGA